MKYIRTENGIYESEHPSKIVIHKEIVPKIDGTFKTFNYELELKAGEILAEADTIEELCDEFVGVDKTCENGHQLLRAIPHKCANFWNGGVYGAIWTTKGLIYVAKLDSEGKLVLI